MRNIPTEAYLNQKVKLVLLRVKGDYIARIDERRRTSRRYEVDIHVPEGFTPSEVKRATPRVLLEHKDYGDFITMRTFEFEGKGKKTDRTAQRKDFYREKDLRRFAKLREEAARELAARGKRYEDGGVALADTTEYDDETGLPPVINDD